MPNPAARLLSFLSDRAAARLADAVRADAAERAAARWAQRRESLFEAYLREQDPRTKEGLGRALAAAEDAHSQSPQDPALAAERAARRIAQTAAAGQGRHRVLGTALAVEILGLSGTGAEQAVGEALRGAVRDDLARKKAAFYGTRA